MDTRAFLAKLQRSVPDFYTALPKEKSEVDFRVRVESDSTCEKIFEIIGSDLDAQDPVDILYRLMKLMENRWREIWDRDGNFFHSYSRANKLLIYLAIILGAVIEKPVFELLLPGVNIIDENLRSFQTVNNGVKAKVEVIIKEAKERAEKLRFDQLFLRDDGKTAMPVERCFEYLEKKAAGADLSAITALLTPRAAEPNKEKDKEKPPAFEGFTESEIARLSNHSAQARLLYHSITLKRSDVQTQKKELQTAIRGNEYQVTASYPESEVKMMELLMQGVERDYDLVKLMIRLPRLEWPAFLARTNLGINTLFNLMLDPGMKIVELTADNKSHLIGACREKWGKIMKSYMDKDRTFPEYDDTELRAWAFLYAKVYEYIRENEPETNGFRITLWLPQVVNDAVGSQPKSVKLGGCTELGGFILGHKIDPQTKAIGAQLVNPKTGKPFELHELTDWDTWKTTPALNSGELAKLSSVIVGAGQELAKRSKESDDMHQQLNAGGRALGMKAS